MKKIIAKILVGILAVSALFGGLVGCSSASWSGTTMKSWGDGDIVGGFIGAKQNYVYYINGIGSYAEDNSFGAPVKGALMAADIKDLSKTEIVVPKLFIATDYNAGLYIFGDYVYYGTSNTDKDSSGNIASTELSFMKTKLDGTESKKLFTLSSHSSEYRVVEKDGEVYIVYYDTTDTALKVYSDKDGKSTVIAKTDSKTQDMEALNAYKFMESGSQVVVYYTTTVYTENYIEDKENRATASYNKVYSYTVGDVAVEGASFLGKAVIDGEDKNATYAFTLVKDGALYYTETVNSVATTYALGNSDKITNTTAVANTTIFDGEYVYTLADGVITKSVLRGKYGEQTQKVAIVTGASALIAKVGNDMYYTDSESGISRIELENESANAVKISEASVSSAWYKPQFLTIEGVTYLFYCDNSATGASYVKYVDVNGTVVPDPDNDGENDKFYLEGQKSLGQLTAKDSASIFDANLNAVSTKMVNGALAFEKDDKGEFEVTDDGKIYVEKVRELRAEYNALSEDVKKAVSSTSVQTLEKYEKAVEKANLYYQLEGIRSDMADKDAFEVIYNNVKAEIQAFENSSDYSSISSLIGNNLLWNYYKADSLFGEEA